MIIGLSGPEGAGKSTIMAYLAIMHARTGLPLLCFPGFNVYWEGHQLNKTIRVEDWITFGEESRALLQNSMLCIDELQVWFDTMSYADIKSRLFASLGAQRRKMNMAIVFTVQDTSWIYGRLRWLVHVFGECYDLFWSPWGKSEGLKRGELIRLNLYDMKGFYHGEPNAMISSLKIKSRPLWNCFNSYDPVNVWEGITKIRIKKPEMELRFEEGEAKSPEKPPNAYPPQEDFLGRVGLVNEDIA